MSSFHVPVSLLDHTLKGKKKMRGEKGNDFFPGNLITSYCFTKKTKISQKLIFSVVVQ